jgi:nucleobase transporter 1/2
MAVGGILSVILDNIVPGTPEERGLIQWQGIKPKEKDDTAMRDLKVYDLPFGIGNSWKISKFLPFMPYYPEETSEREEEPVALQEYRSTTDGGNKTS